nr:XRE family transcriptional regulator [Desulfobacterales bacterium]
MFKRHLRKQRLIDKKIGSKIKQIRKTLGFSQIELAERIGISFQQIQKYEKGSTRLSVTRLQQISEALGVNIAVFFEEAEKTTKVSDFAVRYTTAGDPLDPLSPLNKEEITLLKLFRRTKNTKVRQGIIMQLKGVIELENKK